MKIRNCFVSCLLTFCLTLTFVQPFAAQADEFIDLLVRAEIVKAQVFDAQEDITLVDVRSHYEYQQNHIKGAISKSYEDIIKLETLPYYKDQALILYCGCPHHLSGLSARHLQKLGHQNVKILDEGYFYWKDAMGYPISSQKTSSTDLPLTSFDILGVLHNSKQLPIAQTNIFLIHKKTRQIEATRTDEIGQFVMQMHFYGVDADDAFEIVVDGKVVKNAHFSELTERLYVISEGGFSDDSIARLESSEAY
ncbi:rhodanese-like domain-containing protein [Catenovulum sediminis]|uniref:Rhodanese-like domain-containing protein n=1 Tax=Catenovulum sediminis TaxID=1740262 RepID=A0ABV1RLR0_9ALTE